MFRSLRLTDYRNGAAVSHGSSTMIGATAKPSHASLPAKAREENVETGTAESHTSGPTCNRGSPSLDGLVVG